MRGVCVLSKPHRTYAIWNGHERATTMATYAVSENDRCPTDACRGQCTFAAVTSELPPRVCSPPLGLADDPDHKRKDQGCEQHPEEQREQGPEQSSPHHPAAHHPTYAAHHAVAHPAAGET